MGGRRCDRSAAHLARSAYVRRRRADGVSRDEPDRALRSAGRRERAARPHRMRLSAAPPSPKGRARTRCGRLDSPDGVEHLIESRTIRRLRSALSRVRPHSSRSLSVSVSTATVITMKAKVKAEKSAGIANSPTREMMPLHQSLQRARIQSRAQPEGRSSIGRAPVSKTGGCRFESCRPCGHHCTEILFLSGFPSFWTPFPESARPGWIPPDSGGY